MRFASTLVVLPNVIVPLASLLLLQVYLITELLMGGELLDAVLSRGSYNEADARVCFKQFLQGIEYLHSKCVQRSCQTLVKLTEAACIGLHFFFLSWTAL